MDTLTRSCCLFVLLALWGAVPARANLVQNGDFAGGGDAGWTFAVQNVEILPGEQLVNTPPCSGCGSGATFQSVPINGGFGWFDPVDVDYGTLSQTLATTPGQSYRISYLLGVTGGSAGAFFSAFGGEAFLPSVTELLLPGHPLAPPGYLDTLPSNCSYPLSIQCNLFFGSTSGQLQLSLESFTWTATSGSTVLEFAGTAPGASFIVSDVSVAPVPVSEPASITLMLVVFAAAATIWGTRGHSLACFSRSSAGGAGARSFLW